MFTLRLGSAYSRTRPLTGPGCIPPGVYPHRMAHAHHPRPPHHGHGHGPSRLSAHGALRISLVLTAGFMLVEAAVGWYTGSLALLADAGHMLSDSGAPVFALVAQRFASRAHDRRATFGYRRAEVLAAFLNGIALALISVWIGVEALRRW